MEAALHPLWHPEGFEKHAESLVGAAGRVSVSTGWKNEGFGRPALKTKNLPSSHKVHSKTSNQNEQTESETAERRANCRFLTERWWKVTWKRLTRLGWAKDSGERGWETGNWNPWPSREFQQNHTQPPAPPTGLDVSSNSASPAVSPLWPHLMSPLCMLGEGVDSHKYHCIAWWEKSLWGSSQSSRSAQQQLLWYVLDTRFLFRQHGGS